MYLIGAILIVACILIYFAIKLAFKFNRLKKARERYNGVHLGEMTHHDLPKNISGKYTGYYQDKRKQLKGKSTYGKEEKRT